MRHARRARVDRAQHAACPLVRLSRAAPAAPACDTPSAHAYTHPPTPHAHPPRTPRTHTHTPHTHARNRTQLYNLNSKYGSEEELLELNQALLEAGIRPVSDIVINHRCADIQNDKGEWVIYGECVRVVVGGGGWRGGSEVVGWWAGKEGQAAGEPGRARSLSLPNAPPPHRAAPPAPPHHHTRAHTPNAQATT